MNLILEEQVNNVMFGDIFDLKTMKIGVDALLKMKKGKMNIFLMQHLFKSQMFFNWMFH
jgi:hypothetical protein